jgi:hypothetical protein
MRKLHRADVAELADALGSGLSSRKGVEVQVLSSAPPSFLNGFSVPVKLAGHRAFSLFGNFTLFALRNEANRRFRLLPSFSSVIAKPLAET